jgi:hypothetical protein
MGCNGGELKNVWNYLESDGIVSETCNPYSSGESKVAKCSKTSCENPEVEFKKYKCTKGTIVEAVNK